MQSDAQAAPVVAVAKPKAKTPKHASGLILSVARVGRRLRAGAGKKHVSATALVSYTAACQKILDLVVEDGFDRMKKTKTLTPTIISETFRANPEVDKMFDYPIINTLRSKKRKASAAAEVDKKPKTEENGHADTNETKE